MNLDVMFGRVYKTYFFGMIINNHTSIINPVLLFSKATNFDLSNADINKEHLLSPRKIDTYGKAIRYGRALLTLAWVVNMLFLHTLRESAMRKDEIINRRLLRTFGTIPEGKKPHLNSSFYFFG